MPDRFGLIMTMRANCFSGVLNDSLAGFQFKLKRLAAGLAPQYPCPSVHAAIYRVIAFLIQEPLTETPPVALRQGDKEKG